MSCEKCGYKPLPNPLHPLFTAAGAGLMVEFLNHMTPEPGFYTNWYDAWWGFNAALCGISMIMFFVTCGIRMGRETSHRRL